MDHLPQVQEPALDEILVPLLDDRTWKSTYASYPASQSLSREDLLAGNFTNRDPGKLEAHLQKWLFFGMLSAVFLNRVDSGHFIKRDQQGQPYITTQHLPMYTAELEIMLRRLAEQVASDEFTAGISAGRERLEGHLTRAHACLSEVSGFLANHIVPLGDGGPLRQEILLSILVLGSSLSHMMLQLRNRLLEVLYVAGPFTFQISWPQSDFLRERVLGAGWCPNEYERLSSTMATPTLYYASFLRRSGVGNNHARCSKDQCVANNVDEKSYKSAHVTTGCHCTHLMPNMQKIHAILEDGGIPLIQITVLNDPFDCLLNVLDARSGVNFVALSHVWSDGLGNAQDNSLPRCQLARLRTIVDASYGYYGEPVATKVEKGVSWIKRLALTLGGALTPIWIDTLCVPVHKRLRKLAISRLKQTYRQADRVIVLDAELQTSPFNSLVEALTRISCSGWIRRLWTLQEGILARANLYVQFYEYVLNFKKASEDLLVQASLGPLLCHSVFEDISATALRRAIILDPTLQWCPKIVRLWEMLCWRSSTREGDASLVLASLLGIDTLGLQDVPVDQRMKAIYSSLNVFPQAILFVGGRRFREQDMSWAPVGFQNPTEQLLRNITPGFPTERGLRVTYPGFICMTNQRLESDRFLLEDLEDFQSYNVDVIREEDTPTPESMQSFPNLAVIIKPADADMLALEDKTNWRVGLNMNGHLLGVLVSIYGQERNSAPENIPLYAHFQTRVRVSKATDFQNNASTEANPEKLANLRRRKLQALTRPATQSWCVG